MKGRYEEETVQMKMARVTIMTGIPHPSSLTNVCFRHELSWTVGGARDPY